MRLRTAPARAQASVAARRLADRAGARLHRAQHGGSPFAVALLRRPSSVVRRRRWRDQRAFSLVETLIVCALISTLASISAGIYVNALKAARVTRAIGDLYAIEFDIRAFYEEHHRYPTTLSEARPIVPNDPWGRPYVYTDLSQKGSKGAARKDGKLNPINSDFDLYSVGEDGETAGPLKPPQSRDDIIRARDGAFVGLAADF
jgi:general secretion pathway protein G